MVFTTSIESILSLIVHIFNWFFNNFCRESDYSIIWFVWTTSIVFGWVNIIMVLPIKG